MTKTERIKKTLIETKQRRGNQICKVFSLKLNKSHFNKQTLETVRLMFLEAKWLSNHAIANDVFSTDYKLKTVNVKGKDKFEQREIIHISSHMKQGLLDKIKEDIYNLSKKKANGSKVGKLKFKRFVKTIPLKQFGNTYKIISKNHISIQNIKQKLRVRGLKQIPPDAEFANAFFIYNHGDYYVNLVTYIPKDSEYSENRNQPGKDTAIGMDMGLRNQITFSNGISIKYRIGISDRIKKLYQAISRTQNRSNNRYKLRLKLQKEFALINNIKTDTKNKIVSILGRHYDTVCYQNDDISSWQRIWGSKVMDTAIGGITGILEERISTPVEVDRVFPSTDLCLNCGSMKEMKLSDLVYDCPVCGFKIDRDYNAAINIVREGLKQIPAERRDVKPVETETTTLVIRDALNGIPYVRASLVSESGSLTALA